MRLSQIATATDREKALDALAKSAGRQTNWKATKIGVTDGARASDPFRSIGMDVDSKYAKRMHAALDRILDEELKKRSESEEPLSARDQVMLDELRETLDELVGTSGPRRRKQHALDHERTRVVYRPAPRVNHREGYIADSDFISRYFDPDKLCRKAASEVYDRVYAAQKNNANRSHWTGLHYFLHSQPPGTRIKDCRPQTLSALVSKTLAAA